MPHNRSKFLLMNCLAQYMLGLRENSLEHKKKSLKKTNRVYFNPYSLENYVKHVLPNIYRTH